MSLSILNQYEKLGFAKARLNRVFKGLTRPALHGSNHTRLREIEKKGTAFASLSDQQLLDKALSLKKSVSSGALEISRICASAFALVREASRRTTGLYHYPEQILAGFTLIRGGISEMATGEGKTLAITLPAFTLGLLGKGVHVVTVNSYLAQRDFEFSAPVYELLGLSVGHLPEENDLPAKREAYRKDITYGVGYEFGFDYLRDQLALMRQPHPGPREHLRDAILGNRSSSPETVQRSLSAAIIDEVDSVLIDEAGSPLLIAEGARPEEDDGEAHGLARQIALSLSEKTHYLIEPSSRKVQLTQPGFDSIHENSAVPWHTLRRPWQNYVLNALRAEHLFHRDAHYVVDEEDKVVIIDEFTGRRHQERTWREGLHQAVETKEAVPLRPEHQDAASITRQRFFSQYEQICGLTGTAAESAGEMWHFFQMTVAPVPLHKPNRRKVFRERIFNAQDAMYQAVIAEIVQRNRKSQPVLVGTRTIKVSEALSELLDQSGIQHRVLTAKQDSEESELVATAGNTGSVLIATNMAGRGTQIDLLPDAEAAGGLHVISVERNESARIDRQLMGRGARQGQPGSAQRFVSADDHLFEQYDRRLGEQIRRARASETGQVSSSFSKLIERLQQKVERIRYGHRLQMAHRDEWLDQIKKTLA